MIIGLTGRARSGKDAIADILVKHHNFTKIAFAGPIKEMTQKLLQMTPATLEQTKDYGLHHLDGVTPRRIMQTLGTDWGRDIIHKELWIRIAEERMNLLMETSEEGRNLVFTDVRFDNEAEMLLAYDASIYQVNRPGIGGVAQHVSEAGISDEYIDGYIYNSGSLEELEEVIHQFIKQLELWRGPQPHDKPAS